VGCEVDDPPGGQYHSTVALRSHLRGPTAGPLEVAVQRQYHAAGTSNVIVVQKGTEIRLCNICSYIQVKRGQADRVSELRLHGPYFDTKCSSLYGCCKFTKMRKNITCNIYIFTKIFTGYKSTYLNCSPLGYKAL
jgi:hypothetical protein